VSARARIERPRGTHDVVPSEQPLWGHVVDEAEGVCRLYGYRPILTPVFEDTALFERTSGAGSDVVQKEMYTFEDRGGRSLTLRPEGTAPICRAYVEHGMHRDPQPVKLYTIASMYRYGAPGRGRHITIYANPGHAYMVVDGRRFDTSAISETGSRWTSTHRSSAGYTVRHPRGL